MAGLSRRGTAVLIHGLSETRQAWRRLVAFLERSVDVIAYDARGFGASPTGAADGTVRQMADDLAQVLSATETGPVWLVGFSMGGAIAQRFALDFADWTEGLVLIASSSTVSRAGEEHYFKLLSCTRGD
ncbi:MAG: alpha/beta fold hydrolase [Nitrospinota bacterium]